MRLAAALLATLLLEQATGRELPLAEREAWRRRLAWPQSYELSWQATHARPEGAGISLHALGGELYLIRVETFAAALQPGQLFYVYDARSQRGQLLGLAWIGLDADGSRVARQAVELVGRAEFDPAGRVLTLLARGPGDCGERIRWRFQQGRPLLKEVRARPCPAPDMPTSPHPNGTGPVSGAGAESRPAQPGMPQTWPETWPEIWPEIWPGFRPAF